MKRLFFVLFLLLAVANVSLHAVKKDTQIILDEIKKLTLITQNLEEKITIVSTEFSSMYKKIQIIESKVNAITKSQADVNQTKENLVLSLQFIKEEINDLKNSLSKINDQLLATPPPADPLSTQDTENADPAQNTVIQSPDSIYYTAYSDYLKKNYQLAIDGFKQFIQYYPNHGLADNAYYWIGECYYTQKMYQDAINTFSEIINNHQSGDKIPDATLKKGFTLIEMGKQAQGIDTLKELISKFPLTDEAKLAQQKINEVVE